MTASVGEDPVFVEVRVCDHIRIAAERAAIAHSTTVSELLEDILISYLAKSGYFSDIPK
jgi:hypothetical protein